MEHIRPRPAPGRWAGPRRADALFAVAVLVALAVSFALRDSRGFPARGPDGRRYDDLAGYVYWTRLVTLGGIQAAYSGSYLETYATYGPVILYTYQAVGNAYRLLVDPSYDRERAEENPWLVRGIKAVALGWHLLTAGAIYLLVRRTAGPTRAACAGALYVASPAALFGIGRWAQPDGAHSLFAVLAVGCLSAGALTWGWVMLTLGALAKPQGAVLLPLVVLASWRAGGARGLASGLGAGAAAAAVVLLPFIVTGRLGEVLTLPGTIASVLPAVTANAHNAWWLVLAHRGVAEPLAVRDTAPVLGPLTYRAVAAVLVAAQFLLGGWLYWTGRARLAEAAALCALGWFVFTTQAHENHLFVALPLLVLAWPERPHLLLVFGVLSLTVLINMVTGPSLAALLSGLARDQEGRLIAGLRVLNAATNVLCLAAWAGAACWRRPRQTRAGSAGCAGASRRAQGGLLA
jgi:hypothetical protein